MRVSDLTRAKPTPVTIELGDGDTIALLFDRNKVTPAWVTQGMKQEFLSEALADVILEWDVVNDDNTAFAISAENMSLFSFSAQSKLLEHIVSASVPSRAEGNDLSPLPATASTTSTEQPATHQNGAATLPSPTPSVSPSLT